MDFQILLTLINDKDVLVFFLQVLFVAMLLERLYVHITHKTKLNKSLIMVLFICLLLSFTYTPRYTFREMPPKVEFGENVTDPYQEIRSLMVGRQLLTRDITDSKVLTVMKDVPRHRFIPTELWGKAHEDHSLPIGYGQTISQPYIVALMTQSLSVKPTDKVLEVGTGSGYQAAILSALVEEVYSIEIVPELAARANRTMKEVGIKNVWIKAGDGYWGWEEYSPFDAIIVTAAVDHVPPPLLAQLKVGGLLILPLGDTRTYQTLTLIEKRSDEEYKLKYITGVRFVPLTGAGTETNA
ncbi:MAG: protein-L-isoaspartate(D-aspartate) O-methyltransferase [Candidatus Altiarchaeota archaeon]